MKIIKGQLMELGPSVTKRDSDKLVFTHYRFVRLDQCRETNDEGAEKEIKNGQLGELQVSDTLDGVLKNELQESGEVTLWIENGHLCGLETSRGRRFSANMDKDLYWLLCFYIICGIGLMPLAGLGCVPLWMAYRVFERIQAKESADELHEQWENEAVSPS